MIIQLCPEHQELAGTMTTDQIRAAWTWWDCSCRIILDND